MKNEDLNVMTVPKFTPGDFLYLDGPSQIDRQVRFSDTMTTNSVSSSEDALREAGEHWKLTEECAE